VDAASFQVIPVIERPKIAWFPGPVNKTIGPKLLAVTVYRPAALNFNLYQPGGFHPTLTQVYSPGRQYINSTLPAAAILGFGVHSPFQLNIMTGKLFRPLAGGLFTYTSPKPPQKQKKQPYYHYPLTPVQDITSQGQAAGNQDRSKNYSRLYR